MPESHSESPAEAAPKAERRRTGAFLLAAALAVVGLVAWLVVAVPGPVGTPLGRAAPLGDPSIAVLPFDNLSPDPDNEYFASGVHDELLTHLSQIQDLRVISRTTMLRYAGTRRSVRDIARDLGVGTVLEGSVRRDGDHVRIAVQLIDGRTDAHIWSATYDREVTDVLAVQSEVAREVARALEARLTPREEETLARRPTDDSDAYQFYLRGTDWLRRGNGQEQLTQALAMFGQALERDPDFAEAWAGLASAHLDLYWYDHDRTTARLREGRTAAEKALELAPELPAARMAMAAAHYRARDFERSLALSEGVLRQAPSYPEVPYRIATIYRRQGRWQESTRLFERAVALDPMNGDKITNLAVNYLVLQRFGDAEETFKRSIAAGPDGGSGPYLSLGDTYLAWRGDLPSARDAVSRVPDAFRPAREARLAFYDAVAGRHADGIDRLASLEDDAWVAFATPLGGPVVLARAVLYDAMGAEPIADSLYAEAVRVLEAAISDEYEDPGSGRTNTRSALALAYAGMGEKRAAVETALEAVDALPLNQDAVWGADRLLALAYVYTAVGELERAVETLDRLLAVPTRYSPAWLRIDPFLVPLRGDPAFDAMVNRAARQGPRTIVS